jgi:hypothetical protein
MLSESFSRYAYYKSFGVELDWSPRILMTWANSFVCPIFRTPDFDLPESVTSVVIAGVFLIFDRKVSAPEFAIQRNGRSA